jgi:hypothetical protein
MDTQHNFSNPTAFFKRNSSEISDKYKTNIFKSEDDNNFTKNNDDDLLLHKE